MGRLKNMKLKSIIFAFIAIISSVVFSFQPVLAMGGKYDEVFFRKSNVYVYDPSDTCIASKAGTTQKVTGADNEEKIMNYFISQKLTAKQAAGITAALKIQSGYSAFKQEDGETWPEGGYGIAMFKDGQRTAVVDAIKNEVGAINFDLYYKAVYGKAVFSSTGYIPDGVTETINDDFLFAELGYLNKYISSFVPSTMPDRVKDLSTDQSLIIGDGVKFIDYIKTLDSESSVAKAWTYLYDYSDNRRTSATTSGATASAIVANAANAASNNSCSIGAGGFSMEQATKYAEKYFNEKKGYFLNELGSTFWAQPGQVNQCTALIMYSMNRYVAPLGNTDHGRGTADKVAGSLSGFYEIVSQDKIKPFTVFSLRDGEAGHTGMILGIQDDGSIIIVESNVRFIRNDGTPNFSVSQGLLESAHFGAKNDPDSDDPGIVAIEHWASVDAWLAVMGGMGGWSLSDPVFASPIDPEAVLAKVEI